MNTLKNRENETNEGLKVIFIKNKYKGSDLLNDIDTFATNQAQKTSSDHKA